MSIEGVLSARTNIPQKDNMSDSVPEPEAVAPGPLETISVHAFYANRLQIWIHTHSVA